MNKSDEYLSIKCRNISVVAMVCVVMIHSNSLISSCYAPEAVKQGCGFLFYTLTSWAVPFFFMMSGYWFGRGAYVQGGGYRRLLMNKARTIGVPYLIFSLIGLIVALPLGCWQNHIHGDLLSSGLLQYLDILSIGSVLPHGNGPLWYVRSLLILFLLAPLWRFVYHKARWVFLIVAVLSLINPPIVIDGVVPFRLSQTAIFFLGVYLSGSRVLSIYGDKRTSLMVSSFAIVLALAIKGITGVLDFTGILLLIGVWFLYDSLEIKTMSSLSSYTFFVYCTHIVVLNLSLPVARIIGSGNWIVMLVNTFVCCVFGVAFPLCLGMVARRTVPKVYQTMVGGR